MNIRASKGLIRMEELSMSLQETSMNRGAFKGLLWIQELLKDFYK